MPKTPDNSFRSAPARSRRHAVGEGDPPVVHRRCLACGFTMSPIRLLAQTSEGLQGELAYVRLETESAAYMNRFPVDGRVRGRICRACGRIELYGETDD